MKTEEDEAFDDLARKQGMWGGGFQAKRAAAADKQEPWDWAAGEYDGVRRKAQPAQSMKVEGPLHVVCQCDKCKAQPAQKPDYWLGYGLQAHTEKPFEGATSLYTTPILPAQPTKEHVTSILPPFPEPQVHDANGWTITYYSASQMTAYALEAVKDALAAQPAQEPVALVVDGVLVKSELPEKYTGHLYTTPTQRPWVGLTDEEIHKADPLPHVMFDQQRIDFARAIEAKLKEKNT